MLLASEKGAEVVAVHILHDVVPDALVIAQLVALNDALVVDLLHDLLFGLEESEIFLVLGQLVVENLDRDDLVAGFVKGLPDRRHAADADFFDESQIR